MDDSAVGILGIFHRKKVLVSLTIVAALVMASGLAALALSGSTAKTVLTIEDMSSDPEEGSVNQIIEWTVVVEIQDHGQQGKGLLFTWDWDDGNYTVYELKSLGSNSTALDVETHAWSEPGIYEVVVSVWDGYGPEQNAFHNVSATTLFAVNPEEVNTPPVARFIVDPENGDVDTLFMFNANLSSDLEDPVESLQVRWDWNGDGEWDTNYTGYLTICHQFTLLGVYPVTLEVMDTGGLTNWTYREVTVVSSVILTPHDPIHIVGDQEFKDLAALEMWEGNGTEDQPYIIEKYAITGGGAESAISVEDTTVHFVIRQCELSEGYGSAVRLFNVENGVVDRNTFIDCPFYSLYCQESRHISFTSNEVAHGSHCMGVFESEDVLVANNTVEDSDWWPLWISWSKYVRLTENRFYGSGIEIGGSFEEHWTTLEIDDSNTVNDQPVYYYKNQAGGATPGRAGQIILANCTDMFIQSDVTGSISLGFSERNTIAGCSVSSVHIGITLSFSPGNTVVSTTVTDCAYGIKTENSPDTVITSSAFDHCGYSMYIQQSDRPLVINNSVSYSQWYGIFLYYSSFGQVRYNHISRSADEGIMLLCACYNLIASNDFIENAVQAVEHETSTDNVWNDDYPTGGNYWSDYSGTDHYSGENQTEPGPDGIGDTPYQLLSGSLDRYPLMEPCMPGPTNTPPVADFTVEPQTGTVDTLFRFDAASSRDYEDDVGDLQVRWDWESDGVWDTSWTYAKNETHTYSAEGVYAVTLAVMDSGGLTGLTDRTVVVSGPTEYTPHDPIYIEGNSAFTAENGVVAGDGTAGNPYVIAGWDISASTAVGVSIKSTTAYYVLRDMRIHSGTAVGPYYYEGIRLESASNGRIERVETYDNSLDLSIRYSSNLVIMNNDLTNDFSGTISLLSCSNVGIYNNTLDTDSLGVALQYTTYVTARGNTFTGDGFNFYGGSVSHFDTHVITSDNEVAGEPVLYYSHQNGISLDGVEAAQVIIAACDYISLSGLDLSNVAQGLVLAYVWDATVDNCRFESDLRNCIKVQSSGNVTLVRNTISDSLYYALEVISSTNVMISDNVITGCSYGVVIRYSSAGVLIESNLGFDNFAAVLLYKVPEPVHVRENNLSFNDIGIFMSGTTGAEVVGNSIAYNGLQGIRMESGSVSNHFYHNNFVGNGAHVVEEYAGANSWDNGYPDGGNYWDDYNGVDQFSGPDQDEAGADGIGDRPYVLDSGSEDRYPLMEVLLPPLNLTSICVDATSQSQLLESMPEMAPGGVSPEAVTRE